jgi:hypothetical protein
MKTRKQFLYNPDDPKKSFDVYIDKDPSNTIHIKYTTVQDVKDTIHKLEQLYKSKKYTHKRIWQVAMIMKVRLQVLQRKKPEQYSLSKKYFNFLKKRTTRVTLQTRTFRPAQRGMMILRCVLVGLLTVTVSRTAGTWQATCQALLSQPTKGKLC